MLRASVIHGRRKQSFDKTSNEKNMRFVCLLLCGAFSSVFAESIAKSNVVADDVDNFDGRTLLMGFFPPDESVPSPSPYVKKPLPSLGLPHHLEKPKRDDTPWSFRHEYASNTKGKGKGMAHKTYHLRKKMKKIEEPILDQELWQRDPDPDKYKWLKRDEEHHIEGLKSRDGGGYWKQMKWTMHWKENKMGKTKGQKDKENAKGQWEKGGHTWTMWKSKWKSQKMKQKSRMWSGKGKYNMWKEKYKGKGKEKPWKGKGRKGNGWKGKGWKAKNETEPLGVWFRKTDPPSILNATDAPSAIPTVTSRPTSVPTSLPTRSPVITSTPTPMPTIAPFPAAVPQPTSLPTSSPTAAPVVTPAEPEPTSLPTASPTTAPVATPVDPQPTSLPTASPTTAPVSTPVDPQPTSLPTESPTTAPVATPADPQPTSLPTSTPTVAPVAISEPEPTISPSEPPSFLPSSEVPSIFPSTFPSFEDRPSIAEPEPEVSVIPSTFPSTFPSTAEPEPDG